MSRRYFAHLSVSLGGASSASERYTTCQSSCSERAKSIGVAQEACKRLAPLALFLSVYLQSPNAEPGES